MKNKLSRFGPILVGLGVALVGFVGVGVTSHPVPDESDFSVTLEEVRRFAAATPEALPREVRSLKVGIGKAPRHVIRGGSSFRIQALPTYSYQIVYDDRYVIIDAVNDEETQKEVFPWSDFLPENYERMQEVLRGASKILLTHEHFDHAAGISRSPYFAEIAPRVRMTAEQLSSPEMEASKFTRAHQNALAPVTYDRMHAPAPGVVLIKAPGHTPGTQMIFVRLQDGNEFLFVGDIAWHMDNIRVPIMHPRWVSWFLKEDVVAMGHQLRWLHDIHETDNVHIVVAHDGDQMDEYLARGLFHDGLRGP